MPGYQCDGVSLPRGALVKAMLIHGTAPMRAWDRMDLTNDDGGSILEVLSTPPDMSQGFGRVTLDSILLSAAMTPATAGVGLWLSYETVASGMSASFPFHLISTDYPLKVTVCWYDPPASVSASKQLLNDLDVTIKDETTGEVYYANGATSSGDADELNPTEKIEIAAPSTTDGEYTITVAASTFPETAEQAFAIVVTGAGYYVDPSTSWGALNTPPTGFPTLSPAPSEPPTSAPSAHPTVSAKPSLPPTHMPTTLAPTHDPTKGPYSKSADDDENNLGMVLVIIACVAVCLICIVCGAICAFRSRAGTNGQQAGSRGALAKVMVRVPEGLNAGDTIVAPHPDYPSGITIVVPPGVGPGELLEVKAPPATEVGLELGNIYR